MKGTPRALRASATGCTEAPLRLQSSTAASMGRSTSPIASSTRAAEPSTSAPASARPASSSMASRMASSTMMIRMPSTLEDFSLGGRPWDSPAGPGCSGAARGAGCPGASASALPEPVTRTFSPEVRKSDETAPSSSLPVTSSNSSVPKPLRTGGETRGPPLSLQSSAKPPSPVALQRRSTWPASEERAP